MSCTTAAQLEIACVEVGPSKLRGMSKRPNSKQKRRRSGFPFPKKRTSLGVGTANPHKATTKCVATAGGSLASATIDLIADSSDPYSLNLVLWDKSRARVAPRIEY